MKSKVYQTPFSVWDKAINMEGIIKMLFTPFTHLPFLALIRKRKEKNIDHNFLFIHCFSFSFYKGIQSFISPLVWKPFKNMNFFFFCQFAKELLSLEQKKKKKKEKKKTKKKEEKKHKKKKEKKVGIYILFRNYNNCCVI